MSRSATSSRPVRAAFLAAAFGLALTGPAMAVAKHLLPVPPATLAVMKAADVAPNAPILVRAFKREAEMEVWKQARNGRYVLIKTFPVCRWSGRLGPKRGKGDRQTPEGFYPITQKQLNPNSSYHLAFDTGFPNAYDRANRASGSALMVHGTCSSSGCFAMTDAGIEEIYALARDALAGGQWAFQFQSFPFRMTAENMVRYRADLQNVAFWVQLKEGYDRFEATRVEPTVGLTGKRYTYVPYADRTVEQAALDRINGEQRRVAEILAAGASAYRISYADGGQHPSFAAMARAGANLGDVSRPEALAAAGVETAVPGTNVKVALRLPPPRVLPPEVPVVRGMPPEVIAALAGARVPASPDPAAPGAPVPAPPTDVAGALQAVAAQGAVPAAPAPPQGIEAVLARAPDPIPGAEAQPMAPAPVTAVASVPEPPEPPKPPPVRRF